VPNIKSKIKDVKKNRVNRLRNVSAKSAVKSAVKKVVAKTADKDVDQAAAALRAAQKMTDTTWSRGIIHKNKAARLKSRLARKVNRVARESSKG
jgi:small subunit ribosomal protein S20